MVRRCIEQAGWWVGASAIGFLQWQLLRRRFDSAGWWIPTAVVAMVTAGAVATRAGGALDSACGIAAMAAIMGLLLIWLLPYP